MSSPDCCGPCINPDNIIYFRLLYNQGGRFKIIDTIGHVLCVLLFMSGFMASVLIAILIFLRSMANLGFRESMFHHCVASNTMSYHSNILLMFLFVSSQQFKLLFICKPMLQTRNDRKILKHLFRPTISSVAVLIIIAIFSMIESVESTDRAFLKVFIVIPMI
jgi:hypothetical protein